MIISKRRILNLILPALTVKSKCSNTFPHMIRWIYKCEYAKGVAKIAEQFFTVLNCRSFLPLLTGCATGERVLLWREKKKQLIQNIPPKYEIHIKTKLN